MERNIFKSPTKKYYFFPLSQFASFLHTLFWKELCFSVSCHFWYLHVSYLSGAATGPAPLLTSATVTSGAARLLYLLSIYYLLGIFIYWLFTICQVSLFTVYLLSTRYLYLLIIYYLSGYFIYCIFTICQGTLFSVYLPSARSLYLLSIYYLPGIFIYWLFTLCQVYFFTVYLICAR